MLDRFEMERKWSWNGDPAVGPAFNQVMMAPMVANLTDDNGDGSIDERDVPEVVFNTFAAASGYTANGILRAVSGDTGARVWPTAEPSYRTVPGSEIAIGDVDRSSPGPEIATCGTEGFLILVAANGVLLRRFDTPPNAVPCGFDAPMIGDMDGDGTPEIVVRFAIAHADGTVVRTVRPGGAFYNALADVDDDGELEIVGANGVYNMNGTALWDRQNAGALGPAIAGGSVAIADLDLDRDAEVVIVDPSTHAVMAVDARSGATVWGPFDINPAELAQAVAIGGPSGGGPPTIANFDDDPHPEIAFAGGYAFVVFEHDGTRKWWFETTDRSSRVTGSSLFDFEGDGVAEVLYNDERTFRVFRGPDGRVLLDRCNTSGTLWEFPIVVDVDNDGSANIVLMENDYAFGCLDGTPSTTGIHVFGHPRNLWVRTRRIFNQHTYHVTNVEEDGTIPRRERQHWRHERLNNFRQNVQPDGLFDAPDLVLADLTINTQLCPARLSPSVRVVNRGTAGARAGIPVSLYVDDGDRRIRIGRVVTSRSLLPGESELLTLDGGYELLAGRSETSFRFDAVLNDPADDPLLGLNECRTENNAAGPIDASCPLIE